MTRRNSLPAASPSGSAGRSQPVKLASPFTSPALIGYQSEAGVTAALYDARTHQTWVLHPRLREDTASIVKVEIMATAMREAQSRGGRVPAGQLALMTPMIEASDNNAATELLADVGGPNAVKAFDVSAGLTDTTPSSKAYIPGTTLPGWGLTTTTALDEVTLIRRFAYPNAVLSPANREHGLALMESVEPGQSWGVTYGVPAGVTVALKNGWLPLLNLSSDWVVNSIGWVHGRGRDYVLAVLTSGNPTEQAGIDIIQTISKAVFAQLTPSAGG